jgi:hypothetical protein
MAVPYSLNTLVTALIAVANAHRSHPVVPALHAKFEEAKKEQRKRGRAAGGVSRKTLYTYISQLAGFLSSACPSHGEMIASEAAATFIVAEPRCAHRYYSSIPAYQFHALVRFITERNIADVRALVSGRNASGPDDLYYQLVCPSSRYQALS